MDKRKRHQGRVRKKKGRYSRLIVLAVVGLNIAFTIKVLKIFTLTGQEPSTLIGAWFSFTTVELWSLSRIKKKKIEKEMHSMKYRDNDEYMGG